MIGERGVYPVACGTSETCNFLVPAQQPGGAAYVRVCLDNGNFEDLECLRIPRPLQAMGWRHLEGPVAAARDPRMVVAALPCLGQVALEAQQADHARQERPDGAHAVRGSGVFER